MLKNNIEDHDVAGFEKEMKAKYPFLKDAKKKEDHVTMFPLLIKQLEKLIDMEKDNPKACQELSDDLHELIMMHQDYRIDCNSETLYLDVDVETMYDTQYFVTTLAPGIDDFTISDKILRNMLNFVSFTPITQPPIFEIYRCVKSNIVGFRDEDRLYITDVNGNCSAILFDKNATTFIAISVFMPYIPKETVLNDVLRDAAADFCSQQRINDILAHKD